MGKCVTCGSQFEWNFNELVKYKKKIYDKYGTEYYVYRQDEVWYITRKEYFSEIFKTQSIDEYFHISEFKTS